MNAATNGIDNRRHRQQKMAPLVFAAFGFYLLVSLPWLPIIADRKITGGLYSVIFFAFAVVMPVTYITSLAWVGLLRQDEAMGQDMPLRHMWHRLAAMGRPLLSSFGTFVWRSMGISLCAAVPSAFIGVSVSMLTGTSSQTSSTIEVAQDIAQLCIVMLHTYFLSRHYMRFLLVPSFVAQGHCAKPAISLATKTATGHYGKLVPTLMIFCAWPMLATAMAPLAHFALKLPESLAYLFVIAAGIFVLCPLILYAFFSPSRISANLQTNSHTQVNIGL